MTKRATRTGRRRRRSIPGVAQRPFRRVHRPYAPVEVLDDEQVEMIHEASLRILSEIGMDFLHPEAQSILAEAGADVSGERVRFDPEMVLEAVARAPAEFTLHARNPAHSLHIGGDDVVFLTVASAPNASDADGGRRPGNFVDFENLVRLGQSFNAIHAFGGYPVEPVDVHPSVRHLDTLSSFVRLSDKVWHAYSLGRQRILDAIEIVKIARGVDDAQLAEEPSVHSTINTSSPLRLDGPMIEGLIELARRNQVTVITPFTLSGAMAPASIAGALAQQNAEALAGLAFAQVVNPGAPVVYGAFTSNVDMKSGSPAFGTPEYVRAAMAGGQLARRYGLPYRSTNATAGTAVDAQAAYEAQMSLWGAVMGGSNFVMHAAGWMEGGLAASFEKFVIDVEMLQMMAEFLTPLKVDEDELGLAAIAEVGPGGHFFGAQHTLDRYETAFYPPLVSDWQSFENWELSEVGDATQRANRIWKQVLAEYAAPPLDPSIDDALTDFVERRKREGGVETD